MNIEKLEKYLVDKEIIAKFSHYRSGNLYYTIKLDDEIYQFIIETVKIDYIIPLQTEEDCGIEDEQEIIILSEDLGDIYFEKEMSGTDLVIWIKKSIISKNFIKLK